MTKVLNSKTHKDSFLEIKSTYRDLLAIDFEQLIEDSHQRPIVLVFFTPWLGAADVIGYYMQDFADEFSPQIDFYRQDVEQYPSIYERLGIRELPATVFLKDGVMVDFFSGMTSRSVIAAKLQKMLALK